jgi:AraC family transcriptional regulator of adaptative response/methylated-DNA-[protein]-cysteine methyltransferase
MLDRAEPTPTLGEIGRSLGLSPSHVQRTFKRATGLTPRQYAVRRRLDRFKLGLKTSRRVADAIYDAGYGSSRALYEVAHDGLAMKPSAYRARGRGEQIAFAVVETPLGSMAVAATERGVCALRFGADDALIKEMAAEFADAKLVEDPAAVAPYVEAIMEYLAGRQEAFTMPSDVHATAFQRQVWQALRQIPYGETRTYSEVARMIGRPDAVRAVARACATNPLSIIVPCHRVVRADGEPSGYRWGTHRKQALLQREGGARLAAI